MMEVEAGKTVKVSLLQPVVCMDLNNISHFLQEMLKFIFNIFLGPLALPLSSLYGIRYPL